MTIKAWLSKNFLQQMSWSSMRDYPPKTKKAWLYDNFMEMEEIHSGHIEDPWTEANDPLPPPPDIPQTPEDLEPDPCVGDRSLWVRASPSSIDCDSDPGFSLVISPDFQCVTIQQLFIEEGGPVVVDGGGGSLAISTNAEDIKGGLILERGCEGSSSMITLAICDCLCGGCSSVNISLESCVVVCEEVSLAGPETMAANSTGQFVLTGSEVILWSVEGVDATINQKGRVTTGASSCGTLTVTAETKCCGDFSQEVRMDAGMWGTATKECSQSGYNDICGSTSGGGPADCINVSGGRKSFYRFGCNDEECAGLEWFYPCCGKSIPEECELDCGASTVEHVLCYAYQDWECVP